MIKIVLDTNILVSAILYLGKPAEILELLLSQQVIAVISHVLLSELQEVLTKKFGFSTEKFQQIEQKIFNNFSLVYPKQSLSVVRDNDDNRVLEAAVEGNCGYIVTGDKDLLDLGSYRKIKILTAAEFLNLK